MSKPGAVVDQRFELSALLGETNHSAVWAAKDLGGAREVCLKLLKQAAFAADPEAAWRFRREASIMARLDHQHVVKVHALGETPDGMYLVMDLVRGKSIEQLLRGGALEIQVCLELLVQIAEALVHIHRHELLHRDLKPANVLVLGELAAPSVRIIDFGFAEEGAQGPKDKPGEIIGTLQYMAPEQLGLIDRPTGPRADLYAVGCIAYECLTGRPPYEGENPAALISNIQRQQPTPLRELKPSTPPALERLVQKLLSKNPDDRYQSAEGLLGDLQRLREDFQAGRATASFELDLGSRSTLKGIGAVFVGRRAELEKTQGIVNRLSAGQLHLLLVGGISGAGKSAFIREACNQGMASGLRFVRGKCYAMHTSLPYFAITDALNDAFGLLQRHDNKVVMTRKLVEGLREDAGELVRLAPAWRELFPDARPPAYGGEEKDRKRLISVVSTVLRTLSSRERPLAVFLDDLQWADSGTVDLIIELSRALADAGLLLIGTYRSEEVGPEHVLQRVFKLAGQSDLPATRFELGPLTASDTQDLLKKLFGQGPEALAGFIHQRSQGNAFFTCELLRAYGNAGLLKVDAGGLSVDLEAVRAVNLPMDVLNVVLRRMATLSEPAKRVLGLGAMLGRAFTFPVLKFVLEASEEEISNGLSEAAAAQLIHPERDGNVRAYVFAHDKVLEASLELPAEAARPALHRRIGAWYEQVLETDQGDEVVYSLAWHHGRGDDPEKALRFAKLAGDRARERHANERAIEYYRQADRHLEARGVPESDERRVELQIKLAEVLDALGRYADSEQRYRAALAHTRDPLATARLLTKIGYGQQKSGQYDASRDSLLEALRLLGGRVFLSGKGPQLLLPLERLRAFWTQAWVRLFGPRELPDARRALMIEIVTRLWFFIGMVDAAKMYYLAYRLFWMCLPYVKSKDLANTHRIMAITLCQGRRPSFPRAVQHAFRAIDVARGLDARMELATGYTYAGIVESWQAHAAKAIPYLEKGREMLEAIGNQWDLVNSHIFLFRAKKALGHLDDALAHAQAIAQVGEKTGAKGTRSSGFQKMAEVLILKGERRTAFEYAQNALTIAEENKLAFDTFMSNNLLGGLYCREGSFAKAREHYARAIAVNEAPTTSLMRAYVYESYVGWADATVRDPALPPEERAQLLARAARYLDDAVKMERRYKNFLAYAYRARARLHLAEGRLGQARKDLRRAEAQAEADALPLEQAAALVDRADLVLTEGDKEAAVALLGQARGAYEKLGALGELARVDAALARLRPKKEEGEQERESERRLRTLVEVSQFISSVLDSDEVMGRIVDHSVKLMGAERGFLVLQEDGQWRIRVARDANGRRRDESLQEISLTVVEQVAQARKGLVVTDAIADERFASKESVIASNLRSVLCSPLVHQDRLYGVLYLDNRLVTQLFDQKDLDLVSSFANQAAIALSNTQAYVQLKDLNENLEKKVEARTSELASSNAALASSLKELTETQLKLLEAQNEVMQKEMRLARQIQELIVPPRETIHRPGLSVVGHVEPATQVGGDFWTCLPLPEDRTLLLIADVTGHGVGAGMITTITKACCDTLTRTGRSLDLDEVMRTLTGVVYASARGKLSMTAFACIVDPRAQTLIYTNAAHTAAMFMENAQNPPAMKVLINPGEPIGADPNASYLIQSRPYTPGDRLILYTDGLVECTSPEGKDYGPRRLRKIVQSGARLPLELYLQSIVSDASGFFGAQPREDDVTVVVAELQAL